MSDRRARFGNHVATARPARWLDIYCSAALLVVAVALAVLQLAERRSEKRRVPTSIIIAIAALAVGISSIIQLYRVGDTGAHSVWGDEIAHLQQAEQ